MQDLITSFIIQSKECKLAGIGMFRNVSIPAEPDIASKEISPPILEKLFTGREERISDELVKYIAFKKDISLSESLEKIKDWCIETKSKLKDGEEIFFQSLGSLKKEPSGNILFRNQNSISFFEPIHVERVIHKDSDHKVLVGDKETTSSVMNQFFQNDEETGVKNNQWKMISLILLAIALILLFIYFYQHSFSLSSIGTQGEISPQSPLSTYSLQ